MRKLIICGICPCTEHLCSTYICVINYYFIGYEVLFEAGLAVLEVCSGMKTHLFTSIHVSHQPSVCMYGEGYGTWLCVHVCLYATGFT